MKFIKNFPINESNNLDEYTTGEVIDIFTDFCDDWNFTIDPIIRESRIPSQDNMYEHFSFVKRLDHLDDRGKDYYSSSFRHKSLMFSKDDFLNDSRVKIYEQLITDIKTKKYYKDESFLSSLGETCVRLKSIGCEGYCWSCGFREYRIHISINDSNPFLLPAEYKSSNIIFRF